MKGKMILTTFLMICCLTVTGVMAQTPQGPARPQIAPGTPPGKVLTEFLKLTETQSNDLKQLFEKRQSDMQPLQEQLRTKEKIWRELMESPNPNPATVGKLAIDLHTLRGKIAVVQDDFMTSLESLLTEEQQNRLHAAQRAALLEPVVRALRELRIL